VDSQGLIFLKRNSAVGVTCAEAVASGACDRERVANTCRATCGRCKNIPPNTFPPTTSPPPTDLPSTPTPEICVDSVFKFTTDLITRKIGCKNKACGDVQGITHCPVLCDTCSTCVDSQGLIFLKRNSAVGVTCAEAVASGACDRERVANTCRATCGRCKNIPPNTFLPTTSPPPTDLLIGN